MIDDAELLRRYAEEKSEADFAALVERHLAFVYACALRRVGGDTHLAEDVAQHVFTALARQAAPLGRREVLSGWLYLTARNAAVQVVRSERRRRHREEAAHVMNETTLETGSEAEWQRLRPLLDEALDGLREDDREAVLLRFFEGKSFAQVGAKLRLTENTARMRVERALDKLQARLARHGVTSTGAALGIVLANQPVVAVPVGLAATVTGAALTGATATSTLAAGAIGFMSTAKIMTGIASIAAVAAIGISVGQNVRWRAADEAVATMREERNALAARLAAVEERLQRVEKRAQDERLVAPTERPKSAARPQVVAVAAAEAEPAKTFTLEATKEVLARVGPMAIGQINLDPGHVANARAWVKQDPEGVIRWLGTIPAGRQREHSTEVFIAIETSTDPELAFMLANSIERELPRSNRLSDVVRAWAPRDPAAAGRAVAAADLTPEIRARLTRHVEMAAKAQTLQR